MSQSAPAAASAPAQTTAATAAAAATPVAADAPTNRPPDSSFHQQKLSAWQPLLTAGTVFPVFLVLAVVFISIGAVMLARNAQIAEVSLDYTRCTRLGDSSSTPCSHLAELPSFYGNYSVCQCRVEFTLASAMSGQVYAYYALTNFHQNHRKYVKSHDGQQLSGRRSSDLDPECYPYRRDAANAWIAPCGAVANSLFNDTFQLMRRLNDGGGGAAGEQQVPWTRRGISWSADVARKFGRVDTWNGTVKPPNWPVPEADRSPSGYADDEELQVWLAVAALPSFRKLHRRLLHNGSGPFATGLPAGNYTLLINYSYPVVAFGGTKSFVLSTVGFLGGRNAGLGGLAVAVGCLHLALCCLFIVLHVHTRRSREADPFYGMDPQHRVLLEGMTAGVSPAENASDEDIDFEALANT